MNFDLFNGDADGICALHQLRMVTPLDSVLVTGLKRDINLLSKINPIPGDKLTVLDVSLDKNRNELNRFLREGVGVEYFDHHRTRDIPKSENLNAYIDVSPDMCTSLIVNKYLGGSYSNWAIVGAFGDNLHSAARKEAKKHKFSNNDLLQLEELGATLNYNGYGFELSDLYYHPKDLYKMVSRYKDPFSFINEEKGYTKLLNCCKNDLEIVSEIKPILSDDYLSIIHLDDNKSSRRANGIFGNKLAQKYPNKAHALLTEINNGYRVSVRAPLNYRKNADLLCSQFNTGGGRSTAAGINYLDKVNYSDFIDKFIKTYSLKSRLLD